MALNQARIEGRNPVRFFAPDLQLAAETRAVMEHDLHPAISPNHLVLYCQPQGDSPCLIGVEALIRWNHPERGLLLPSEFIHLAQGTGLILPLRKWVLEAACARIANWAHRKLAADITLAVNISPASSARRSSLTRFWPFVLAELQIKSAGGRAQGRAIDEDDARHRDAVLLEHRDNPPLAGGLDILFQVRSGAIRAVHAYDPSQFFCRQQSPNEGRMLMQRFQELDS
ncbi:MAG: EAL domain-containing protein [Acidobacteriaceae bacterium]